MSVPYVNQAERDALDAEVAPSVGEVVVIDERDCCLSVRFTARFLGIDWEPETYTGGPDKGKPFWLEKGYRFDNGVTLEASYWSPGRDEAPG